MKNIGLQKKLKKNKNKLMEKSLKYKCIVKMRAWAKYLQTLLTK